MELLYARASAASKSNPDTQRELLATHIGELVQLIMSNYEDNVMAAAERGSTRAILVVYKLDSKYRGIIPMNNMLFPPAGLSEKMRVYNIADLQTQLKSSIKPFSLQIIPLTRLFEADLPEYDDFRAVMVEWN